MKMLSGLLLYIVASVSPAANLVVSTPYKAAEDSPLIYTLSASSNQDGTYYSLAKLVSSSDSTYSKLALVKVSEDSVSIKHTFDPIINSGYDSSPFPDTTQLFVSSTGVVYGLVSYSGSQTYYFFSYSESTGFVKIKDVFPPFGPIGELSDGTIYGFTKAYFTYKNGVFTIQRELSNTSRKYSSAKLTTVDPGLVISKSGTNFVSEVPIGNHAVGYYSGRTEEGNELYSFYVSSNNITSKNLLHKFASTNGYTKNGNGFLSPEGNTVAWTYTNKNGVLVGRTKYEGEYGYGTLFKIENGVFSVFYQFQNGTSNYVKDVSAQAKIVELSDGSIVVSGDSYLTQVDPATEKVEVVLTKCPQCFVVDVGNKKALGYARPNSVDSYPYNTVYSNLWGNKGAVISFEIVDPEVPTPEGELSLTLTPSNIVADVGTSTLFSWSASNATSCTALGDWSNEIAVSGTYTFTVDTSKEFIVKCTDGTKDIYSSVNVTANKPYTEPTEEPEQPTNWGNISTGSATTQGSSGGCFSVFSFMAIALLFLRRLK